MCDSMKDLRGCSGQNVFCVYCNILRLPTASEKFIDTASMHDKSLLIMLDRANTIMSFPMKFLNTNLL